MNFSVTKNGKPLSKELYTWDEKTKTFSSNESYLVLDFTGIDGVTFRTGHFCTFETSSLCTFKTGSGCTFQTGFNCTFKTGFNCTFDTGSGCTFKTGSRCTFKTYSHCTFDTSSDCTFKTGSKCVVVRRDIFEVIQLKENQKIKLNGCQVKGYKILEDKKTISIDGKDIELSQESFNNLKEFFQNI
jgi:hypothetical protein